MPTPSSSQPSAKTRAAALSIASNSLLIALKLFAGALTGSVGILSDAIHSLMDLVASLVAFASVRKADQPADPSHRFGHERFEDLAALGQAVLLLIGACFVGFEAIRRLIEGGAVTSPGFAMLVAAVAGVANLAVSHHIARTARTVDSSALAANAADLRTDAAVSLGVLVALAVFVLSGARWIDPAVGLAVAAVISVTGARILLGAGRRLSDEALPGDELETLNRVTDSFIGDEIVGFHDIRARHVGNHHQVDLHLQFARGTSLERAHALGHELQHAIAEELPHTSVLMHLEPEDRVRADRFDQPRQLANRRRLVPRSESR